MTEEFIFERTKDLRQVLRIITFPDIWEHSTEDKLHPRRNVLKADDLPLDPIYLLVRDGQVKSVLGLFVFVRRGQSVEIHAALYPVARGRKRSDPIFQGALRWYWEDPAHDRITAVIPQCNRLAVAYAKRNGFQPTGTRPQEWLKGGKLWDMEVLEIRRPD